ncbi:hypothetical protein DE146DRAFT_646356 [Phaeosphaeria sp. MPI-PUGE-AT-0046c]|nr:hypothetical protein DE146DRAFT_646356 [Phaeosphaeria sp. MPI-PUGE-AT-0046c]
MSEYNKQTVAQLRQILKDRGIPSTGLTRKAQIVERLEEDDVKGQEGENRETEGHDAAEQEEVPGPALAEAGEPAPQPVDQPDPPPIPTATLDANRETVSHIDSDIPPPDQNQAVEHTAEDTTMDDEPGTVQPAGVFNAAPADPEDVVGPKITEPADGEEDAEEGKGDAKDELPEALGPAAEALRVKRQEQEALDNVAEERIATPQANETLSIEKPELLTIPEGSTAETSRLNTEELELDTKKRKRRSDSPDLPLQDVKAKKPRPSQEPAPEVHLEGDDDMVMEQRRPDEIDGANVEDPEPAEETSDTPLKKENTDRYKNLVKSSIDNSDQNALQDDRPVAPALHPATPALYIRNFMRPLRPEALRAQLVSLATPPSSSPDASTVKSVFLDAMKTHALVLFTTTTAASRVRASLHGSIWPPEGNRKELWVDFVPDDSVEDWIKQEEDAISADKEARASGRPIPAKRFEVVYPNNSTAIFQEVGAGSTVPADAQAPKGPRGSITSDIRRPSQASGAVPTHDTRQDIEASFKTLDQLFSSTSAKPNLYYLPVSDDISEARIKELDTETSRDWAPGQTRKGRGLKTEMKYKYSFDDNDRLVEVGDDRGPWAEDYRGGGGRGRGGGFRGRGGGGGRAMRGAGIGWRG